jgi:hydroxymethylpyrimidine pyrophosphatase-like HAD family hydrolase
MPFRYRGFAVDYDGTLTDTDVPDADVLAAIADVRAAGRQVILVTGRIMAELLQVFPEVQRHFDAVVTENGCVLYSGQQAGRRLAPEIPRSLERALKECGIPFRAGEVLLASKAKHAPAILAEIGSLGLELQLVRNRAELMVLPSGSNKGTGVIAALAELGVDRHNVVAFGDAENDHSLFDACEIGVAVGNAVDSLKAQADVVLTQAAGAGVAAFIRRVLDGDLALVQPRRWQAEIGSYEDGSAVRVPAAAAGIGIYGESGVGKSYLAGLLAERMLRLGYRACVIDPEGDHYGLAELPGVVGLGGANALPAVGDVIHILARASVVADTAQHDEGVRVGYARRLVEACQASRERTGLPHFLVVDEAHTIFGPDGPLSPLAVSAAGLCLVTYRPDLLATLAHERLAYRITARSASEATIGVGGANERRFRVAERMCQHGRHARKYASALLPTHRRFLFRSGGIPTGRAAASLREFRDELAYAADPVLHHHAAAHDFSSWLGDVCRDPELTFKIRKIEARLAERRTARAAARFRDELFAILSARFPL